MQNPSSSPAIHPDPAERIVRVGCPAHNCGGRCLLVAHVRDGRIIRLDTDDRPGDTIADPQLRACTRGRAYLRRQYHPDRLMHPLRRIGRRGAGQFERDLLGRSARSRRGRDAPGQGDVRQQRAVRPVRHRQLQPAQRLHRARRLMNLFGGCLGIYNSYSWAAINVATPTVYGTLDRPATSARTGSTRSTS